jgi:hypothetical protein
MICPPNNGKNKANMEGHIVKNEMLYMFLDEKLCFIRLPLDTLQ